MKEIRNGTTLFLLLVLIFAFSAQGSLYFFQFDRKNSQFSSSGAEGVTPLRKNILPQTTTPRTGIIPTSNAPRGSINSIINPLPQYFPGSNISIRNRFTVSGLAIVQQVIFIFLFEDSVADQTMIDEANQTDPTTSIYYVHNATTNGIPEGQASYSTDSSHGYIDTTFTIPSLTELQAMGIASDDNVTIFQCYPAYNETSLISKFISHTDTFKLSAAAEFSSEEFINLDSGTNTFRQGENATALLSATSGGTPIENVTVTGWKLYNSTDSVIPDPSSLGIIFNFRDVSSGNPQNTTDVNGELELFVDTTYPTTLEGDYYFNITANFWWTIPDRFYTDNYNQLDPSTNTDFIIANFTVQNDPDIVTDALFSITNAPLTVEPPNVNVTIVTVKIQAQDGYGGPDYDLSNIPVNATLDIQELWVNITPGVGAIDNGTPGWYLTDSNGEIKFNITAGFPTPYQSKTPTITVIADLQNTTAPIYPPAEPHRFLQNNTGGKIVTKTQMISIDPDFLIGEIVYSSRNTSSIRPGETAALYFEVRDSGNTTTKFTGVPVNITLEEPIAGVSLKITNALYPGSNYYYITDGSGIIELFVYSTYLLTPEIVQTIKLNLTVDFENDSNVQWIGTKNAIDLGAADTLENFNKTWVSVIRSNDLIVDPDFYNCTIVFSTTNESGDTTIRSGDDLTVTFVVRDEGGTPLSNVYVNVSLVDPFSYPGVSLTIHPSSGLPDLARNSYYYYTNGSGLITVNISTIYGTTPKELDIELTATADFQNQSYSKWYVGSKGIRSDFRSNNSYSEVTQTIEVRPQYFTGYIYVPTDNPPNELVQQNVTLEIEFRLRLNYAGGNVFPDIDGLNISIQINNTDPSVWNMTVTPYQDSNDSSVTFSIKTNDTGITPEAIYNITATADFGSIKDRTYNFTLPYPSTVPSGELSGVWVNGTDVTGNCSYVTETFEVKNEDIIRIWIPGGGITDSSHGDAGYNAISGFYEVYRGTSTITIEGSYTDKTQEPVVGRQITVSINHTGNIGAPGYLTDDITDGDGLFSVTVTLPPDTPLEDDIMIYGWDSDSPPPVIQEGREGEDRIRVVSTIDLSDYYIFDFNGSSVFVGGTVSINGTLTDNLGQPIDSSIPMFTNSFSELTDHLRIVGWNGTHEIGIADNASLDNDGSYSMSYIIPYDYTGDTLYIRLNITSAGLVHYRVNYTQKLIFVYRDFQIDNLQIYLPNGTTSTVLANNSVYMITGIDNRDISIRGTLKDSTGRGLDAKWINTTWNDSITLRSVDVVPAGNFSIDYSFTGFTSDTWVWQLHHILDNGTVLSKHYYIVLQWVVYDTTEPYFTITSPLTSEGVALLSKNDTTKIIVTVIDPSSAVVSVGLDNSSVTIWINGSNNAMDQDPFSGSIFSYDWDTSNPSDTTYNITISALDLANNWNKLEIMIVIDVVSPSATIEVTEYNNGYLNVGSDGRVLISGTIKDNSSITGLNTGIDNSSARLFILNSNTGSIQINNSISISENEYSYDWVIILDPDDLDLLHRNITFSGTDEWTINLTYSDLSGNVNHTEIDMKLDNTKPTLAIVNDLPDEVDDRLVINITFNDQESGIYLETLTLELLNSTGTVLDDYTIRYGDIRDKSDTEATIVLDTSELLDKGEYSIVISVFDNTGNKNVLPPESFTVNHPSPPNPFGNLFVIILSPILAFGGGIGLAALYERFKGIRGS